jgi:hypothetical protein
MLDRWTLTSTEAADVLTWLDVAPPEPTRAWLDALLAAYARRVPWESASRIVRRADASSPLECVVAPRAFWRHARERGLGGTCFESNAALAALLDEVGLVSTLTINDMPPSRACHTALIVVADGVRCVVDAGLPLYAAVPLPIDQQPTRATSPWLTYTACSTAPGRVLIERMPHPRRQAFELVDVAVSPGTYRDATCADYGPGGLFLDRVVVTKIVDGDIWRFASGDDVWELERFRDGQRDSVPLPAGPEPAGRAVAAHFAMDADVVTRALARVALRD